MHRAKLSVRILAAAAALAFGLTACGGDSGTGAGGTGNDPAAGGGSKGAITVGAYDFPEGRLLAAVYAQALNKAGYSASVTQLGQREVVQPALQKGDLDVVPEYVSSTLNYYQANSATPDDAANLTKLKTLAEPKGVVFYTPAPATDNYAYVVSKEFSEKNDITTLSDLAAYSQSNPVTLGGPQECADRSYCKPGLEKTYGMKIADFKVLVLSSQPAVDSLLKDETQVAVFNSSDGVLAVNPVVVLKDDKGLNPNDYIVPAVNKEASTPELEAALNDVSAKLTQSELLRMNKEVQNDRKAVDKVAEEFVATL